jgi:hypothetical protein
MTEEGLVALEGRHRPTEIPPCRVCGKALSIQAIGGGEPTRWGCSPYEDDPDRPGKIRRIEGRGLADKHFSESYFIDRRHDDPGVIRLLAEVRELRRELAVEKRTSYRLMKLALKIGYCTKGGAPAMNDTDEWLRRERLAAAAEIAGDTHEG